MNRNERSVVLILIVLLLLGLLLWRWRPGGGPPTPVLPVAPSTTTVPVVTPPPHKKPVATKVAGAATGANGAPLPPKLELHKELIPKNIEIVRCYYTDEIAPPGTSFGFDINGSGFTSEFEKMIKVESGQDAVTIKNMHLVTANQLHGEISIGSDAKTGFVYPRVLIQGLPVFRSADPFAVVRKNEVLTVFFVSMEENGRGGKFRVITNLDDDAVKTFQIAPSTPGITVSDLQPQLPYVMNGSLQIGPGVPPGDHGLTITINGKEAYKRIGMIRIVRPNVGQMGFIQNLTAQEKYHRPNDTLEIYVQGTGLSEQDMASLDAKVEGFDMGHASFTYISPLQVRASFKIPAGAPPGSYGLRVVKTSGEQLYEKKDLFSIVPPNWVAGVQVSPPIKAGGQSTLRVRGRDFSESFASSFKIDVDEPGIVLKNLARVDAHTLAADISVSSGVAPGDYWMHLSAGGKKISPPYGSIIKVEPNQ